MVHINSESSFKKQLEALVALYPALGAEFYKDGENESLPANERDLPKRLGEQLRTISAAIKFMKESDSLRLQNESELRQQQSQNNAAMTEYIASERARLHYEGPKEHQLTRNVLVHNLADLLSQSRVIQTHIEGRRKGQHVEYGGGERQGILNDARDFVDTCLSEHGIEPGCKGK